MDKFANQALPPGLSARPPTPFGKVTDTMQDAMSLAKRVMGLADHLIGGVPTALENGLAQSTPDGCLYRLADHAEETQRCVKAAQEALDRIDAVTR